VWHLESHPPLSRTGGVIEMYLDRPGREALPDHRSNFCEQVTVNLRGTYERYFDFEVFAQLSKLLETNVLIHERAT
jgi:hypothetical protein